MPQLYYKERLVGEHSEAKADRVLCCPNNSQETAEEAFGALHYIIKIRGFPTEIMRKGKTYLSGFFTLKVAFRAFNLESAYKGKQLTVSLRITTQVVFRGLSGIM